MRTRELLHLHNTGHQGINALFSKAHSADWDIDRDVDWTIPVEPRRRAWSTTPGRRSVRRRPFRPCPHAVRRYATRRGLGRMLNILQVGESVAQDVCAKIGLVVREEDYRNHAAAQAMDEARHHLAYRRFIEKMDAEPEDIDVGTEMMFDALLAADAPLELIATEQFFLESVAMDIFESIRAHARHPLLRDILTLITRDESRHMGFGILYVAEWMRTHRLDERFAFARRWLGQMLFAATDQPGPIMLGAAAAPLAGSRRRQRRRARAAAAARAAGDQRRRARRGGRTGSASHR